MLKGASCWSFVGGNILAVLAVIAASQSARVEAEPGDRIGRFPVEVPSSPIRDFSADIATAADGRFLVVWEQFPAGTLDESDVMARYFTAAGAPLSAQIQLVSGAADSLVHDNPQVALAPDGTFVVVWQHFDRSAADGTVAEEVNEIQGRRYAANGVPLGPPFIVDSSDASHTYLLRGLAMAADGRFAVAWGLSDFPEQVSYVRLYDADGQPRGVPFEVTDASVSPQVAMSANGQFTVAWAEVPSPGRSNVRLRRFDADGAPLGGIEDVATITFHEVAGPIHLAMSASGQLVVAYMRGEEQVFMRRYDAAGRSLGAEVRVSTDEAVRNWNFVLGGNAAGDFAFAWVENTGLLHTRLYRASGASVTGNQGYSFREISEVPQPRTVGFGPDNFLVVFHLLGPGSGENHLYGQPFAGVRDTRRSCARFIATRNGTAGPDVLHGSAAHDIMYAGGGNDTIYGWGGLDVICGVDGNDVLYGGSGNDQLIGGRGDDLLDGGTGNGDYCNGESHTNADTAVSCEVTRNIP